MTDTYLVNTADEPIGALSSLSTAVVDVIKGYDTMLDKAESDLEPIVQRLHALHEAHAACLLEKVAELGGNPERSGSPMSIVHQAAVTARDWFGELDESAIPTIVDGEERLIESYDDALEAVAGHADVHDMLTEQRAALRAQVFALKEAGGN